MQGERSKGSENFDNNDSSKRLLDPKTGLPEKRQLVEQLVDHVTKVDDCESLITAIHAGNTLFGNKKSPEVQGIGADMLRTLDSYIGKAPAIRYRSMFPLTESSASIAARQPELRTTIHSMSTEIHQQNETIRRFNTAMRIKSAIPNEGIEMFLLALDENIHTMPMGENFFVEIANQQVVDEQITHPRRYDQGRTMYRQTFTELGRARTDPKAALEIPVRLLELDEHIPPDSQSYPKFADRKLNGISYRDITNEEDPEQMANMMLDYLAGMPSDDLFYKTIAESALLAVPTIIDLKAIDISQYGDKAKVLRFFYQAQRIIAEKLLLPAVVPVSQDEGFDQKFNAALHHVDALLQDKLADLVMRQTISGDSVQYALQDRPKEVREQEKVAPEDLTTVEQASPLALYIHDFFRERHPHVRRTIVEGTEMTEFFFKQKKETLLNSLEGRFGLNPHFALFRDKLQDWFNEELIENYRQDILDRFKNNVGERFLEKLEVSTDETTAVTHDMWGKIADKVAYWPATTSSLVVSSEGSFPDVLGIKSVQFRGDGIGNPVAVSLAFKNPSATIIGELSPEGKLSNITLPLDKEPGLRALLEQIAVSRFAALTLRNEIENRRQDVLPDEQQEPEQNEPEEQSEHHPAHERELIRTMHTTETISVKALQDVISKRHEAVTGEREPVLVSAHVKRMVRAGEYLDALSFYNQAVADGVPPHELSAAADILSDARSKMYKLPAESMAAIKLLPEKLRTQAEPIVDPVLQREVFPRRWMFEYINPKPKPEELASPQRIYFNRYKVRNASVVSFVDNYWIYSYLNAAAENPAVFEPDETVEKE